MLATQPLWHNTTKKIEVYIHLCFLSGLLRQHPQGYTDC